MWPSCWRPRSRGFANAGLPPSLVQDIRQINAKVLPADVWVHPDWIKRGRPRDWDTIQNNLGDAGGHMHLRIGKLGVCQKPHHTS